MPFITADEVVRAQKWIEEQGLTPERAGRVNLGRALGVSESRARAILRKVRGEEGLTDTPTLSTAAADREDVLGNKRLKMENDALKSRVNELLAQQVLDQKYQEFISEVSRYATKPFPKWVSDPKRGSKVAMPIAHMSDWHFDEVVDPKQTGYVNGYNRVIAENRLKRFFEKVISLCDDYLKGVNYQGIVLPVSGDMFSGQIHELPESNEAGACESLRHWLDPMGAGIQMLAERFGNVYIPWVVGNHPRTDIKKKAKGGVRDNFDWLLGALLQRDFARMGDKRVQFHVSESFDNSFKVFKTRYLQTHGDQFRGGSGIAAELSPMFIGDSRKRQRYQAMKTPYDVMILGHWHSRICLPTVKCNGTGRGFSEYDLQGNFKFQPPVQSFWLETPEHGITMEAPIFVKCSNEGWELDLSEATPVFEAA